MPAYAWGDLLKKIGFGTQLFGFNKSDVAEYVESLSKSFTEKDLKNKERIKSLEDELKALQKKCSELESVLNDANSRLDYYHAQETKIEKMSVSIGTMYLVAKQNASDIISSAKKCAESIKAEAMKQLSVTEQTEIQLSKVKANVTETAEKLASNISDLTNSLSSIKERLENEFRQLEYPENEVELLCGDIENENT